MKGKALAFILVAGAAAYFLLPEVPESRIVPNAPSLPSSPPPIPTSTPTPSPTSTPSPTPTSTPLPVPTQTPLPTPTPTPTPVNLIGAWGRNRMVDQWFDVWFGRVMLLAFLAIGVYIINLIYRIRLLDKELEYELRALEIEARKAPARPIMTNMTIQDNDLMTSPEGGSISAHLVQDFVAHHRDPGLGLQVSKWKDREGWSQSKIEVILDWLTGVGYITPRARGMAAEWKNNYTSIQLCRLFGLPTHQDMK